MCFCPCCFREFSRCVVQPKLLAGNDTRQIIARLPCYGRAAETFSGAFDSTSLPALRSRGAAQEDRDKVSRLTLWGNQTEPLSFIAQAMNLCQTEPLSRFRTGCEKQP